MVWKGWIHEVDPGMSVLCGGAGLAWAKPAKKKNIVWILCRQASKTLCGYCSCLSLKIVF